MSTPDRWRAGLLSRFVNQTQMASFSTLVGQALWFFGSVVLTLVDAWLLTRQSGEVPLFDVLDPIKAAAAVTVFSAHALAAEQMRQVGLWLAGFLLTAWTGKSISNRYANKDVRETAQEYAPVAEAKERGKAAGNADATRVADQRVRDAITSEHSAPNPAVTVTAQDQSTVKVDASPVEPGPAPAPDHEDERGGHE